MSGRDDERALAALPAETRARLDAFARALEHVRIDDLPLYVTRIDGEEHDEAVRTAEGVAIAADLRDAVGAARRAIADSVMQEYAQSQYRVSIIGLNTSPSMGPSDDRVRVARSLGDAVAAIVLGPHIDEATQAELLGLWDRLLP
jgi:hypothetical protein